MTTWQIWRNLLLLLAFTAILSSQKAAAQPPPLYFPPITNSSGANWDTLPASQLGWCEARIDTLYDYLESVDTKAFIVLKDGKRVLEKYFGTFTEDSLWYWASAGKALTAFTVGLAQEQGFLTIQDSSAKYLGNGWSSMTPAQEGAVNVRHHLTMTTGLEDNVPNLDCTDDTCLTYLAPPGTRWSYHNAPYTLLDEVITNATGQSLNGFVTANIKAPTGMTGSFLPLGYNRVFFSNARSFARFGLLMLARGRWASTTVMTDTAYFNAMVTPSQTLNQSYGYLWWLNGQPSHRLPGTQFTFPGMLLPDAPPDVYSAIGKNGQLLSVQPSQGLVVIRMGEDNTGNLVPTVMINDIWRELGRVICLGNNESPLVQAANPLSITVYPNPSENGEVNLLLDFGGKPSSAVVEVMDLSGRVVYSQNITTNTHQISNLSAGVYVVRARTSAGVAVEKVVVGR